MALHFVTDAAGDAQPGDDVVLEGAEAHHAASVRRLRIDEDVTVGDGRGVWLEGRAISVSPRAVTVVVNVALRPVVPVPANLLVLVISIVPFVCCGQP